jgi:hypothetical protein
MTVPTKTSWAFFGFLAGLVFGYSIFALSADSKGPFVNSLSAGKSSVQSTRSHAENVTVKGVHDGAHPPNLNVFEVDKATWFRRTKKLQSLNPVSVFDWRDLKLSKPLCDALEISDGEKIRLDEVLGRSMKEIVELEKANALIKETDDGEILEIAPYAGELLRERLFRDIAGIIKDPASTTLQAMLENDRMFGGFGQFRQEIWLQTPYDGKFQEEGPLYLHALRFDAAGRLTNHLNARAMSRQHYFERYGMDLMKSKK